MLRSGLKFQGIRRLCAALAFRAQRSAIWRYRRHQECQDSVSGGEQLSGILLHRGARPSTPIRVREGELLTNQASRNHQRIVADADHGVEAQIVAGDEGPSRNPRRSRERAPVTRGRWWPSEQYERRRHRRLDSLPAGTDGRERPRRGGWHGHAHANPPRCRSRHPKRGGAPVNVREPRSGTASAAAARQPQVTQPHRGALARTWKRPLLCTCTHRLMCTRRSAPREREPTPLLSSASFGIPGGLARACPGHSQIQTDVVLVSMAAETCSFLGVNPSG